MEYAFHVFLLCGGIGLFLFGINFMGAGLEKAAGDNLRVILQKLTKRSGNAVLVGAVMTAVIQSSGATMVMAVSFVNAQLMNLTQSLYVMLGASIGTTVTAQIIAFDIDPFAPLILFVGYVLYKFVKGRSAKKAGEIILGFGLLFMGIYLMGDAIGKMNLGALVSSFLSNFNNPILTFLFGLILTLIIQSSSAAVGILQVLVAGSVLADFSLASVLYMVLGMNVGAVAPVVLSSLSANHAAKRATMAEVFTKVASVIFFVVLVLIFPSFLTWIESTTPDPSRQIANLHLVFNLVSGVVLFPLIKPIAALSEKIMPDDPSEEFYAQKLLYVSYTTRVTPAVAIAQVHKEVMRFAQICIENFKLAVSCFFSRNEEDCQKVLEVERTINYLYHELNVYIVKVSAMEVTAKEMNEINAIINVATDLERIADHAENMAEYARAMSETKAVISDAGLSDLKIIIDEAVKMIELSVKIFDTEDRSLLAEANRIEDHVDDLQDLLINNHIDRLTKNQCDPRGGVIYTDLVSELERCSDHALNIAQSVLGSDAPVESHAETDVPVGA